MLYNHIMTATQDIELDNTMQVSKQWAQAFGSKLTLIHAHSSLMQKSVVHSSPLLSQIDVGTYHSIRYRLEILSGQFHGVDTETKVVVGRPKAVILENATKQKVDLIILGRKKGSRHGFSGRLQPVVPCDLLVVNK